MTGLIETEVKIPLTNPDRILERLQSSDYREIASRRFEANTLYDTPELRLRQEGKLLRLREAGENCVITWKGAWTKGAHKSRPEVETWIGSVEKLHRILTEIGFRPTFRYEKYRTEYQTCADDAGVITFDETPIGNFVELEGPGEWIDATAEQLGFAPSDYVLDSYGRLYIADCERRGIVPGNMIFPPGT